MFDFLSTSFDWLTTRWRAGWHYETGPSPLKLFIRELARDRGLEVRECQKILEGFAAQQDKARAIITTNPRAASCRLVAVAQGCATQISVMLEIWETALKAYDENDSALQVSGSDSVAGRFRDLCHTHGRFIKETRQLVPRIASALIDYSMLDSTVANQMIAMMADDLCQRARILCQVTTAFLSIADDFDDGQTDDILALKKSLIATTLIASFERFAVKLDQEAEADKARLRLNGLVNELVAKFRKSLSGDGCTGEVLTQKKVLIRVCVRADDLVGRDAVVEISGAVMDGINNAIGNSHKYAGGVGSRIDVTVVIDRHGGLTATVRDNGIGMSRSVARSLYRKRMKSSSGGTGSGSYDCAQRIRAAGGSIGVTRNESLPSRANGCDHGVTTTITAPGKISL